MARNQGPTNPDDDLAFYRGSRGKSEESASSSRRNRSDVEDDLSSLDDRIVDLDSDEQSPFLRAQKRVPVRRGSLPKKTAVRLKWILICLVIVAVAGAVGTYTYWYGTHSWRFRLESSDSIEISGAHHVRRAQIMHFFAPDLSRNVFFVPLATRKHQIEEIPWVESASVMRLLPNRIKVDVKERTPIAFVEVGSRIDLIDADGVVMSPQNGGTADDKFSFPVITGMEETDPLSTRAARIKIYLQLVDELDAGGGHYSKDLNEVNLSDPDDVKVMLADPSGAVLVHLGSSNFLERYKIFEANIQQWRQQYPKLNSIDLRYERQVIVNPDIGVPPPRMESQSDPVKPAAPKQPARKAKPKAKRHGK